MSRLHRPGIPPVPTAEPRPLWSVMIPTYNCTELLRQTLRSVLQQAPRPDIMQIEVVDDASTGDDPHAVVEDLGGGRVSFYRQPRNLGHVGNFNTCIARARGRLVHILHGDDLVQPSFYATMQAAFEEEPTIGMAFCRSEYVDADGTRMYLPDAERAQAGVLDGWLSRIASGQRIATPSVVVRRDVYEALGGFDSRFRRAGEDWEMWVRIAAHYAVWHEPDALVKYRVVRPGSLTNSTRYNSALIRDMRVATGLVAHHVRGRLSRAEARGALRSARSTYARWALQHAHQLSLDGRPKVALALLVEAVRCSRSRWVLDGVARELRVLARAAARPARGGRPAAQ